MEHNKALNNLKVVLLRINTENRKLRYSSKDDPDKVKEALERKWGVKVSRIAIQNQYITKVKSIIDRVYRRVDEKVMPHLFLTQFGVHGSFSDSNP